MIVDRLEGKYAICECDNGEFVHISRDLICTPVSEGDVLVQQKDRFFVDPAQTQARRAHLRSKMDSLFS